MHNFRLWNNITNNFSIVIEIRKKIGFSVTH